MSSIHWLCRPFSGRNARPHGAPLAPTKTQAAVPDETLAMPPMGATLLDVRTPSLARTMVPWHGRQTVEIEDDSNPEDDA